MPTAAPSLWLRYGVVPVAVAAALLCRLLLWPVVGTELPFLFFWPAVVFAAWYGGLGPGLLAILLSALATNFFLLGPRFSWALVRPADLIGTALFGLLGAVLSFLTAKLQQRIQERTADLTAVNDTLRESEERFRLLVEAGKDYAIILLGPEGRVVSWNAGAERIKGYRAEEIVGQHFSRFYAAEDVQSGKPEMELRVAAAEGRFEDDGWRVRKDGSRFWANVILTALRDREGRLRGFSKVTRDITERRRAEEALARRAEELTRSNAELEQFAYVASHDLQEPLRMVSSYVELLASRYRGQLDERADKYIHYAVDGASRMQALIHDLLAFSRVSTKARPPEPTHCSAALNRALSNLQKTMEETGAVLTQDPLPTVRADATQLTQVFQNLVGNALKFCEARPPRVHVGAERRGQEWVFSVRDNGIGIAPEHRERIFLIFQRLHKRDKYPGTGMGLAICKKVVERHGGRIWVESQPGQGSTFYFTLPDRGEETHDNSDGNGPTR